MVFKHIITLKLPAVKQLHFFLIFILLQGSVSLVFPGDFYELDRIPNDSEIITLIDDLYRSTRQLPPSHDGIVTYADAMELKSLWIHDNENPSEYQKELLRKLKILLPDLSVQKHLSLRPYVSISAGLDFGYLPRQDREDSLSIYQRTFRDRDHILKYDNRGYFASLKLKIPVSANIFTGIQFSGRNDWEKLLIEDYHYPRNLKQFNFEVNRQGFFLYRASQVTLLIGRDFVNLGIGEHGGLFLSDNLPPLDQIRFSYRYKDRLVFNNVIAPVKFYSQLDHVPKILVVHRLDWKITRKFRVGLFESLVTNQRLRAAYLNPFMIFHNVSDYALKRNVLAGFDLEYLWSQRVQSWITVLIDELDVSWVEEVEPKSARRSIGIQAGTKFFEPFNRKNTDLTLEYLYLDKWLYNYPYADGSLTYIYEEERFYKVHYIFNRFIGHYLGSNARAVFADYRVGSVTYFLQVIHQGEVPIFQPAFSEIQSLPTERKYSSGIRLKTAAINNGARLDMFCLYNYVTNYHNIMGRTEQYPEFWIKLSVDVLD